jgi:signal transduction histidine kinase
VAIENARLYEESRRRESWLQASAEITTSLLSGADPDDVLSVVARRAREMTDADLAAVLLPEDGPLMVTIADGTAADQIRNVDVPAVSTLAGEAYATGTSQTLTGVPEDDVPAALADELPLGPLTAVPLGAVQHVRGVLLLAKRAGRMPFSQAELHAVQSFAGQAAIALELAEARADAERLGLLEDRDRIAKDLHDVVIQRLFAVAMTLMSVVRLVDRPEAATRVQGAVDELDATIRQIRSTIFALQTPAGHGLRAQILDLVEGVRGHLGFKPALTMDGRIDSTVPADLAEHLLAVLREALSNLVRHAKATRAEVTVTATPTRLTLDVTDNGVGIGPNTRRSGLRNLHERAEGLGGVFELAAPETGGTRVTWSVPL